MPLPDHLGIAARFSAVLGGDSLAERKPAAAPLLHLCAQFGHAPAADLDGGRVGGGYRCGQRGRHAVGAMRCGYLRGLDPAHSGARWVMDDMRQLLEISRADGAFQSSSASSVSSDTSASGDSVFGITRSGHRAADRHAALGATARWLVPVPAAAAAGVLRESPANGYRPARPQGVQQVETGLEAGAADFEERTHGAGRAQVFFAA